MNVDRRILVGAAAFALLAGSTAYAQNADIPPPDSSASDMPPDMSASTTQSVPSSTTYSSSIASADDKAQPTNGPYIGIEGGGNFVNPISPHRGPADSVNSHLENGYAGAITVGYGFGNGLRAELEAGYRRNDIHTAKNTGFSPSGPTGALGMYTVMANGIYDLDLGLIGVPSFGLTPHIGIGVGWAQPRFDHAGYYAGTTVSGKDDLLAYQGIAGFDYAVTPDVKVNLDYHYLGTTVGHFHNAFTTTKSSITDQSVMIGVRYELNPEPPPPPSPAPPPPPPPPPAPAAAPAAQPEPNRNFQVFFDFDKSVLTRSARGIILQAANVAKAGDSVRLHVTGHTDTVGSVRYNLKLSQRRAAAVKRALIADGVPGGEIMTQGVGKTDLLVPTPDQVREPQNRRATIVFDEGTAPGS